jgi:hypothetical protein
MPPGCYSAACVITLGRSFVFPVSLAVDGGGNVFVSDAGHAKVYKIEIQDSPSLSFDSTPLGTPSVSQLVTVGNNGNLPLTISALTLTNASLGTGTTCTTGSAVASASACGLDIEFTPATPGSPLTGSVSIADNDLFNANATQIIPLTGSGTQQTPTLTLASVATVGYGSNSLLLVWLMWTGTGVVPTGAVTFSVDNGIMLKASCTGTTSPITCVYSGSFAVGLHTLAASYAGDTNYAGAAAAPESFTISTTTLTIKANNASRLYGAANPAFTGSVSGAQPGDSFVESFTTPATTLSPVATYAIVPSATGANVSAYMETIVNGTLTIAQAPTTISFSASSPSLSSGQSVVFTAQVSPSTSGRPTGIVTVLDNGALLTTLTLNGGLATYATTALSPGIAHVLTATYGGDSNFLGTTASGTPAGTVTVPVGGTDTAITPISGTSFTLIPGGALSFDLLLTPQPGAYPGPITFAISGLPPGATATLSPPSLSAVTSPTTVHVTIQTAASTAKFIRMHGDIGAIALGLLLIPVGCSRRTRKRLSKASFFAVLLGGVLSSMVITGCGSSGYFRQESRNYTLTITATSGSVKHVATITMNIQ